MQKKHKVIGGTVGTGLTLVFVGLFWFGCTKERDRAKDDEATTLRERLARAEEQNAYLRKKHNDTNVVVVTNVSPPVSSDPFAVRNVRRVLVEYDDGSLYTASSNSLPVLNIQTNSSGGFTLNATLKNSEFQPARLSDLKSGETVVETIRKANQNVESKNEQLQEKERELKNVQSELATRTAELATTRQYFSNLVETLVRSGVAEIKNQ
jgi:hypothetical protein